MAKKTFCTISSKIPKKKAKIILLKLNSNFYLNHSNRKYKLKLKKKITFNPKVYNEIFYVLFTSGSTGEPKGVKLSYSNIMNTIIWSKKFINWI
jgi:long-subunit acyl-CoA synthetase (AMP-forming)